ncbi:MAG: hypothetical protein KME47_20930 [Nodosilinea sp. WJT8-NPBG4]|jgi:hypothetical protein|nr:hypothetical protein [Nodosilinea sp. WJT8-NPBG4]
MSSLIYRLFAVVEYVRATMHLGRVPGDRDRVPDTYQHLLSDRDRILDTRDRMLDTYGRILDTRDRMLDTHQRLFGDRDREAYHVSVMTKFSLEGVIEPTIPVRANNRLPRRGLP